MPTHPTLPMLHDLTRLLDRSFDSHLEDLKTLVRIPSVSFPGFPESEVRRSAEAVAALLRRRGLENTKILELPGAHPYVYADHLHAPGAPTLLLYAHHDVQPAGREEVWESPAFEPTVRPGPGGDRMYARGSADDKAGVVVHTAAIATWLEVAGRLPVNVKVIIEGEEEIGSTHLSEFLARYRELLDADILVLTDTGNFDCGIPALTVALRGLVGMGVEVRALKGSVHSGMWGGPVPDPAMALSKMLASLVDEEGRIVVPGVLDQCTPVSPVEEAEFRKVPFSESEFRKQSGMVPGTRLIREKDQPEALHPAIQVWRRPSLTINAIQASSRANPGNIINDAAWAKVTIRVAAGMDPVKVRDQLESFLRSKVPWGLQVEFKHEACAPAWATQPVGPAFDAARAAMKQGYGHEPLMVGCGGTIPFVQPFADALGGAPALLIGVEDPYTNAHGENESLLISDLKKAMLSQALLFEELALRFKERKLS